MFERFESPYDHLARVKEWSQQGRGGIEMTMQIPQETKDAQARASDPENSAWVSANAGSGKTFVLARRVIPAVAGRHRTFQDPVPHLHQGGGG